MRHATANVPEKVTTLTPPILTSHPSVPSVYLAAERQLLAHLLRLPPEGTELRQGDAEQQDVRRVLRDQPRRVLRAAPDSREDSQA